MSSAANDDDKKPVHFFAHPDGITRPLGTYFHPTRASFSPSQQSSGDGEGRRPASANDTRWSSRASRKRRYTHSTVPLSHSTQKRITKDGLAATTGSSSTTPTTMPSTVSQRFRHPHSQLKPQLTWDVSFWAAVMFVLGSAAWICNGHLLYTPLSPTPSPDHATAAAWLAFAGGSLFALGAYLAYVEALNAGHEQMFVELRRRAAAATATDGDKESASRNASDEHLTKKDDGKPFKFRWIGTGSPRDIGYLASAIQLFAASIFWVSTVTGLPNVLPTLATAWPPHATTIIFFWTPQVIGGAGFIVASVLLMLEEQKKWWRIEPLRIGWQVGVWNLIGAIGFMLCGGLGYGSTASTKVNYQSVMCTFWGSWAFMIGSVAQLWEVIWREPGDTKDSDSQAPKGGEQPQSAV
ncbi:hypothetical protein BC835DRAFT_1414167 [Cytidiella melzeri]|nr:hypothetical protein BC835DRAFT_1414167 [Cytidiella melzeri]